MKTHARVVVIGGGIAGCSVAYHLTRAGCTDVVLLERGELTSGSTWHAAGNCPNFSASWNIIKLQHYSTELYAGLEAETGAAIAYHRTGSLRLAHSRDRMDEFRHVAAMARAQGIGFELLTPPELAARHPFVELHDLEGALWDPGDGDIDPSQVTQALAKGARGRGAEIHRFAPVEAIARTPGGEWQVRTAKGTVTAEIVVNAAGYRAREVGAMVGLDLPIVSLEHQYLVSEPVPALEARGGLLPLLRDPDESYYLRQERKGLLLGPYERDCRTWGANGIPPEFGMELLPDDLERLEPYIAKAIARVPILGAAGIRRVVNGPIPYTPDGLPLIGPAYGLENFHLCCAFSFGIVQGGGAGKAMAEIIAEGEPEWDLWACDPRRFTDHANKAYTIARAVELYQREYDIVYPVEERPAGRPAKATPLRDRLKAKGARFGARGGWEQAVWFASPDLAEEPRPSFRRPGWFAAVGAEARAVRERAGVLDLAGLAKFLVDGPEAAGFLDRLIAGLLPAVGRAGRAYACTPKGGIHSELTITRLAEDRFFLCGPAAAERHDHQWLLRHRPTGGGVRIENVTARSATLLLAGPRAREVLARVTGADLSDDAFPWSSARAIDIGFTSALAVRINCVGELGWEIHLPLEYELSVYERLMEAGAAQGIADFGLYAMDSLRLETGDPVWKTDLTQEVTPLEASLDRFVDFGKPVDFIGRDALLRQKETGVRRRLVPLLVDAAGVDPVGGAPLFRHGRTVGTVSSGGYGHAVGSSLALAYVERALALPDTRLEVEVLGLRRPAVVARAPIRDAERGRMTG